MVTQNVYEQIYFIQKIIEEGDGDTGRLNFIKECLENQKSLFKSDQHYLDEYLISKEERTQPSTESDASKITKTSTIETNVLTQETAEISKLKAKLAKSNDQVLHLEKTLEEKKLEVEKPIPPPEPQKAPELKPVPTPEPQKNQEPKLRGVMPKDWKPYEQLVPKIEVTRIYKSQAKAKKKKQSK